MEGKLSYGVKEVHGKVSGQPTVILDDKESGVRAKLYKLEVDRGMEFSTAVERLESFRSAQLAMGVDEDQLRAQPSGFWVQLRTINRFRHVLLALEKQDAATTGDGARTNVRAGPTLPLWAAAC